MRQGCDEGQLRNDVQRAKDTHSGVDAPAGADPVGAAKPVDEPLGVTTGGIGRDGTRLPVGFKLMVGAAEPVSVVVVVVVGVGDALP